MVVELVGPAGAGKSTLAHHVCRRDARLRGPIGLWGLPVAYLTVGALRLSPFVVRAALQGYVPRWAALLQMIRLEALRVVVDHAAAERRAVVLDEGPVFGLGWLEVFFPANGDRLARQWRQRVMRQWAERLDLVFVLDAANGTLAQRIQTRAKPHMVKGLPDAEIDAFTERYRAVLGELVRALAAVGVTSVTVPTDGHSSREAAALVAAWLEPLRDG